MKSPHHQIAFSIVTRHGNVLLDDEPLEGLIEDIAGALQDAFDLGFKAAGGSVESTMEHIARDIRDGIFPKKSTTDEERLRERQLDEADAINSRFAP